MQAGLLNTVIDIYKPCIEINEYGEQVQTYHLCNETRAQVVYQNGNRAIQNDEVVFDYTKTFIVRRYVSLNENYQIKYQGNFYRILSIEENRARNNKTIIAEKIQD